MPQLTKNIVNRPGRWGRLALGILAGVGGSVGRQAADIRHTAAVIGTVFCVGIQPRLWRRPVWKALAHQVLTIGIEPLWFVGAVAVFVGMSVVVQLTFWTGEAGQSQLLGPMLMAVVARELGPLLINLIVIVRSGSAMTTELGILKVNGQVREPEAQESDPFARSFCQLSFRRIGRRETIIANVQ